MSPSFTKVMEDCDSNRLDTSETITAFLYKLSILLDDNLTNGPLRVCFTYEGGSIFIYTTVWSIQTSDTSTLS